MHSELTAIRPPLPAVATPTVFSPTFRQVTLPPLPKIIPSYHDSLVDLSSPPLPLTHSRSDTQYLPPADTPSTPAVTAPGSKSGVDDYGRSSARDEGYPEEKASTPAPAAASMWDWSQFTTNTSPFKDKGTVKDKGSNKDKNKEKNKETGKNKEKDKSSVKDVEKGLNSSPFESTRREASRLRYATHSHETYSNDTITQHTFNAVLSHTAPTL